MKKLLRMAKEGIRKRLFFRINEKESRKDFEGTLSDDYIDSNSAPLTIEDFLPVRSECNSTPIEMAKHLEDQILGEKCFNPSSPVISWLENVKEIIERYIWMTENFDQWPETWGDYL